MAGTADHPESFWLGGRTEELFGLSECRVVVARSCDYEDRMLRLQRVIARTHKACELGRPERSGDKAPRRAGVARWRRCPRARPRAASNPCRGERSWLRWP